jgi:DNA-binding MarR family transcriptional regulator
MQQSSENEFRRQAQQMVQQCLGRRVARLQRLVGRRVDAELRPFGVTGPQVEMLSEMVALDEPARPSEIAVRLGLERSTISRNLDVMVQRGLVQVAGTTSSGRTSRVAVTEAGFRTLAQVQPVWERAQEWISAAVGANALETMDAWIVALEAEGTPRG